MCLETFREKRDFPCKAPSSMMLQALAYPRTYNRSYKAHCIT